MIISSTVESPQYTPDTGFRTAGWFTIIGIIVAGVDAVIAITSLTNPNLKPLYLIRVPLIILRVGFAVYCLGQFKRLLNERYDIHEANGIITSLIIFEIAWGVDAMMIFPFVGIPPLGPLGILHNVFAALLFLTVYGVLGIVLGVYLLRPGYFSIGIKFYSLNLLFPMHPSVEASYPDIQVSTDPVIVMMNYPGYTRKLFV
ncbi:MAG: hypothetical protein P8Z37_15100 [Acidobacteriota bacterium]